MSVTTLIAGSLPANIVLGDSLGFKITFDIASNVVDSATISITHDAIDSPYTFLVTARDDETPPTALCQNIAVYLDGFGGASVSAADVDAGSFDNCTSTPLTSLSQTTFGCMDVGPNTVTMTVSDQVGNSAMCMSTVTVIDTISPNPQCQDITVFLDASGNVTITPADIDNGSSDNCTSTPLNLGLSQMAFTCTDIGDNTVTLTVTDASNNEATCTATVTVLDTISPTATCQNITVYLDASGSVMWTEVVQMPVALTLCHCPKRSLTVWM